MFPNKVLTRYSIKKIKGKKKDPGCVMACEEHTRIICAGSQGELNSQTPSPPPTERAVSLCSHLQSKTLMYMVTPALLSAAGTCLVIMHLHQQSPRCCSQHAAPKIPSNMTPFKLLVFVKAACAVCRCSPSPPAPARDTGAQPGLKGQCYCVLPVPNKPSHQAVTDKT